MANSKKAAALRTSAPLTEQKQRTRESTTPKNGRVSIHNVNVPNFRSTLDEGKYGAVKKALLRVLPVKAPGLTQAEMCEAVLRYLPDDLFPAGAKAMWWTKMVQLDLEAKRAVTRDHASKPLRWTKCR